MTAIIFGRSFLSVVTILKAARILDIHTYTYILYWLFPTGLFRVNVTLQYITKFKNAESQTHDKC